MRLAEHLLKTPGTRLLLVGRTELPEEHTWDALIAAGDGPGRRLAAFRSLREQGDVRYESADITDAEQVRTAVGKAAAEWSAPLAGVLHLAGSFDQRAVTDYTPREWRAALAAKVTGGWVLHRLAQEHPAASFVAFSSVNGYFGGSMSGAYSAANAFLDALAAHRRHAGADAQSLAWSMWDELGMSEGYGLKALSEARGYRVLDAAAGLRSYDLVRSLDEPHVLIGADRGAPWVRGHVLAPARPVHRLAGRVALEDGADIGAVHLAAPAPPARWAPPTRGSCGRPAPPWPPAGRRTARRHRTARAAWRRPWPRSGAGSWSGTTWASRRTSSTSAATRCSWSARPRRSTRNWAAN
ncbi:SDR family oxidoreductase [Streptomyces stramineus]